MPIFWSGIPWHQSCKTVSGRGSSVSVWLTFSITFLSRFYHVSSTKKVSHLTRQRDKYIYLFKNNLLNNECFLDSNWPVEQNSSRFFRWVQWTGSGSHNDMRVESFDIWPSDSTFILIWIKYIFFFASDTKWKWLKDWERHFQSILHK